METKTTGAATYSPEDNKLRLYVGRVSREEFLKLRAEGWVTLHKQREAGGGDFAAVWTPSRRDTALEYSGGIIEDEDMGPAERAADRAERFSGYRDKRTLNATDHADGYEAAPTAHGYQDPERAERAAEKHDRMADRAGDAWSKAEYWQRRTAGVIAHALHLAAPGVRMGRIKTLEAELRRYAGSGCDWETHLTLRLAYENQMLAAQGGRLEQYEVLAGGKIGGKLILKASKSNVTGRVTSVKLLGPKVGSGWHYQVSNIPGTEFAEYHFDTERMNPDSYTPPTPESLAELAKFKAGQKAAAPVKDPCPLINPTDADAERLQAVWNERARLAYSESMLRQYGKGYDKDWKPSTVCRITQAVYSAASNGSYARAETRGVGADCELRGTHYNAKVIKELCQIRTTGSDGNIYGAKRVIVLTDKPQKPIPVSVWEKSAPEVAKPSYTIKCSACGYTERRSMWEKTSNVLFPAAIVCPFCDMIHAETNADLTAPTAAQAVNA